MWIARFSCLLIALWLAGCAPVGNEPVLGEGFVAPATLNLRNELGPRQPSVATVRHGERVEILARRRRFVKVRAGSGAVGWTDGGLLFNPEQMEELRALGRTAAQMPSQGKATVLDPLNVHTNPERQAPSFHQIREGEHVTVVAHRLVAAAPRMEDWTLVGISKTQAGWVLTRNLVMAIPDEVAQYAERHRITSYFSLGEVRDGDQVKHNWLWTTIAKGSQPYEFDSARVFVWSQRRHRYETAYIERKLKGYYPVEVHADGRTPAEFLPHRGGKGWRTLPPDLRIPGLPRAHDRQEPLASPVSSSPHPYGYRGRAGKTAGAVLSRPRRRGIGRPAPPHLRPLAPRPHLRCWALKKGTARPGKVRLNFRLRPRWHSRWRSSLQARKIASACPGHWPGCRGKPCLWPGSADRLQRTRRSS